MRMQLKQPWLRRLFDAFTEDVLQASPRPRTLLENHLACWLRLDAGVSREEQLNGERVSELFTVAEQRRWNSTMTFLRRWGVAVPDRATRRLLAERERINTLIHAEAPLIRHWQQQFADYLVRTARRALAPHTMRVYLRASLNFLVSPGCDVRVGVSADQLQKHLTRHPGDQASLSRFLRYLEASGVAVTSSSSSNVDALDKPTRRHAGRPTALAVRHVSEALRLCTEPALPRRRAGLALLLARLYDVDLQRVLVIPRAEWRDVQGRCNGIGMVSHHWSWTSGSLRCFVLGSAILLGRDTYLRTR